MKNNKCTLDYCPQCEQDRLYKKEMCQSCNGRGVQSGGAGECHYCNGEGFVFVEYGGKLPVVKKPKLINVKEFVKMAKKVRESFEEEWIDITNVNCRFLKKYGIKPFRIMKYKMRKEDGTVWNNINFFEAKKQAEKLGCRLPDIREILALLEQYKKNNEVVSCYDKSFLGIKELSYHENVYHEWGQVGSDVAFVRGGYWANDAYAGVFTLLLNYPPAFQSNYIGFRCCKNV